MKVRYPSFDFEAVFPHWSPDIEFAHKWNAISITPPTIEPYLIKVLQKAKPLIKDAALLKEVDLFIAQESQHFRQHVKFNRCFQTPEYGQVIKDEARLKAELDDFLANRSLKFNLAYAEGFESSMGVLNAQIWFEDFDKYREGAKPEALALWDWHMAEEWEHRELCYKVYHAVCCRGLYNKIVNGYFYRLYGVWFCMKHLGTHAGRAMYHLMKVEWGKMTPQEVEASKARLAEINSVHQKSLSRNIWKVLSPFYNPKGKRAPRGAEAMLLSVEPGGKYAASKAVAA